MTGESMIARVARVLRAFDAEHDALTLTELASRTGLPMATTHRIIRDLLTEGLLERHGSRYLIGTALWERGELARISLHFREATLPYLLTLYEATSENVHLAVREGLDALYVARLVGPHSVPTISRMGGRLPLHTTGVGRALLAFQSDAFLEEFFSHPLEQPTAYSLSARKRCARNWSAPNAPVTASPTRR